MTRLERQSALSTILECEARCHGWPADEVEHLRMELADWWRTDANACEAYLAAESMLARHHLAQLTRGVSA